MHTDTFFLMMRRDIIKIDTKSESFRMRYVCMKVHAETPLKIRIYFKFFCLLKLKTIKLVLKFNYITHS